MSEWSEKAIEILKKHVERKNNIEDILKKLLNELNFKYQANLELVDTNNLVWEVQIALKTFTLTDKEILSKQQICKVDKDGFSFVPNEIRNLEEVIQELILEKIS